MKTFAQYALLTLASLAFLHNLHTDCNGMPEQEAMGFTGVVGSILAFIILLFLLFKAGAFTSILP
jgi:hypothetical protein